MDVIILAAGRGKRLKPFTDIIPKPLLPIKGQAVIKELTEMLFDLGFNQQNIVIGYKGEMIRKYLKAHLSDEITFNFFWQKKLLGSADALMKARPGIHRDFLYLASDTTFQPDEINKMIIEFKQFSLPALIAVKKAPTRQLSRRSSVLITEDGFISQIIEKPEPGQELSRISAAPLMIFSDVIWDYLNRLTPNSKGIYELATSIQEMIDDGLEVKAFPISYSQDITYPEDILRLNFDYLEGILNDVDGGR